jgi:hypothetical protein
MPPGLRVQVKPAAINRAGTSAMPKQGRAPGIESKPDPEMATTVPGVPEAGVRRIRGTTLKVGTLEDGSPVFPVMVSVYPSL